MWIVDKIIPLIYIYIRPFIKWFLHSFTRLCELQRLCYGAQSGAKRTKRVENSLLLSKNSEIRQLIRELDEAAEFCRKEELWQFPNRAVLVVCRAKHIKPRCHPDFANLFGATILQIWSYKRLMHDVERLRSEQYDSENLDHEQKLISLWNYLMPKQPLVGRITKQWQEIGFQGDDPKTDFRGMGMLGLDNLLYFAQEYNEGAKQILLHSMHPTLGYTLAIVGINMTSLAYGLLKRSSAKTHFYNLAQATNQICSLEQFHKFYCYLLFEFDRFWIESQPTNIMDFREIYQTFEIEIMSALQKDDTMFITKL